MNQDRESLAQLVTHVMKARYKSQAFEDDDKEAWIRAALEGDPIVLLEAAWSYWTTGDKGFRPSPGMLRNVAHSWRIERHPYVTLKVALSVESPMGGLVALIQRFGPERFEGARKRIRQMPSDEARWLHVNIEHRLFIYAKKLMTERQAPAWNPNEMGSLTVSTSTMVALVSPRITDELPGLEFNAKVNALAQKVQVSARQSSLTSLD